jgi:predicted DNA binding CopG/RHH family protein
VLRARPNKHGPVTVHLIYHPRNVDSGHLGERHESKREKGVSGVMKRKDLHFKTEDEERDFWSSHDSTEFVDWTKAKRVVLSNLKPSVRTISLRLPEAMLEGLKLLANKRDVPYQSLIKVFLAERIEQELRNQTTPITKA